MMASYYLRRANICIARAVLACCVMLCACKTGELGKEVEYATYKGEWGVPLGTRTEDFMGFLGELFTDNMQPVFDQQDNPQDIIYCRYETTLTRHIIDDLVRIPTFTPRSFRIDQGAEVLPQFSEFEDPLHQGLHDLEGSDAVRNPDFPALTDGNGNEVILDSFVLSQGQILLTVELLYHADISLNISWPSIVDAHGAALRKRLTFPYSETQGELVTRRILLPIHDRIFRLHRDDVSLRSTFRMDASWTITALKDVGIPADDYFRVTYTVQPERVQEASGFFGHEKSMLLFGDDAQIMLEDPARDLDFANAKFSAVRLQISFHNPHGIPMALEATQIRFLNVDLQETPLQPHEGDLVPLSFLPRQDALGTVEKTLLSFDRTTANMDIITASNSLYAFRLPVWVMLNPPAPHPQERNNFVVRAPILVKVAFDVPFNMVFNDMVKTFDYDNEYKQEAGYFERVTLRFLTKNGIPLSGHLNVFFTDDNGNRIYSSKDQVLLKAPEINERGEVVKPYTGLDEITLDGTGTEALTRAEKIHTEVVMNTSLHQGQKRFALFARDQKVAVTVSVRAEFEVDEEDLDE